MIKKRKRLVLSLLLLLPSVALAVRVAALPFDAFEDTISESATNIPFAADFRTMSRIEFTLALDASPTNAVEVSVGTDADVEGRTARTKKWTSPC